MAVKRLQVHLVNKHPRAGLFRDISHRTDCRFVSIRAARIVQVREDDQLGLRSNLAFDFRRIDSKPVFEASLKTPELCAR